MDETSNKKAIDKNEYRFGEHKDFNKQGIHITTNEKYDPEGYDVYGYDQRGFNRHGKHKITKTYKDTHGIDCNGFNDRLIHCETGTKYDNEGYDYYGFNKEGIHKKTLTKYNEHGLDSKGFNKEGWNESGINKETLTKYDKEGYDLFGYDSKNYNRRGLHRLGYLRPERKEVRETQKKSEQKSYEGHKISNSIYMQEIYDLIGYHGFVQRKESETQHTQSKVSSSVHRSTQTTKTWGVTKKSASRSPRCMCGKYRDGGEEICPQCRGFICNKCRRCLCDYSGY